MSTVETQPQRQEASPVPEVVNDFSIQVATVNGSGSQSSNNVLMRSIFQMGVPISGKNLFPSNIAGLPTWFTIRVSKEGYVARDAVIDIALPLNPETAKEDVESLEPGKVVVYDEKQNLKRYRDDLIFYPVPLVALAAEVVANPRLRKLVANMVYVGSVAELIKIDMSEVEIAIQKWFKGKQKAVEINIQAAHLGAKYVKENLTKQDPYRIERLDLTKNKIIIDGNSACALGSLFAGVTVVTWYPITPSSSLAESLTGYLERFRRDPKTGKASFAVVQAEDEMAAVGMAIGAGWAGARAMTATSGPGISLMSEFAGLAYLAEIPVVIFNIQRVGPSTGLPTRTSQGDILSMYYLSHGDTKHVVILPGSMRECFDLSLEAFNIAEKLQQPVFVASDLDLGMNNWMADPFPYPEGPIDRGKVLNEKDLEKLGEFGRYKDVDGDAIPYRTIPGNPHSLAAYFTRGSGHDESAAYSERPEDYKALMDRLIRKLETARGLMPESIVDYDEGAEVGVIGYGSSDAAIQECRDQLLQESKIATHYLRIRAVPLRQEVIEFVLKCRRVYFVEQNRDGQLADVLQLEVPEEASKIRKILHYDGLPLDARFITNRIQEMEKGEGN